MNSTFGDLNVFLCVYRSTGWCSHFKGAVQADAFHKVYDHETHYKTASSRAAHSTDRSTGSLVPLRIHAFYGKQHQPFH